MTMRFVLVIIFLCCLSMDCLAQRANKRGRTREWRGIITTALSGKDCRPALGAKDKDATICKGIEGYSLLLKGDENKPEIFLIAPNGRRHPIEYWDTTDSKYQGLMGFVTWVIVYPPRKRTIGFIIRPNIARRQDYTYSDSYDIIARVTPGPVCIVGSVPAGSTSAMESMAIADFPAGRPCLALNEREKQDWFLTARRLAGEGKVPDAEQALTRIKEPSERFIVYREISNAQFRAGDAESARRTLMTAREETLKNPPTTYGIEHTLGQVISGLTEAGFYDAAKSDIKLLDESDRLGTFLGIAWLQFERNDLEAAKITYRDAIQVELNRTPRQEWNLVRICQSQVRIGLIDEARYTVSLISDPDARKSAESSLPPRPE